MLSYFKGVVKASLSPLGVTLKILSVRNSPFDLHVLGMPPAFVLSQDQTLEFNLDFINFFTDFLKLTLRKRNVRF